MNDMIKLGSMVLTMSSREIAELTGKQHQHVRHDIEAMLSALELDASSFGHVYRDSKNRAQSEFLLPKDLTLTLVAGYNVKLRKKIIDRWIELEEGVKPQFQIPKTMAEALRLAADLDEMNAKMAAIFLSRVFHSFPHVPSMPLYRNLLITQ